MKETPDQQLIRYMMAHPEPTAEELAEERAERTRALQESCNKRERFWLKRIRRWREELQRASATPGIMGACIVLTRPVIGGQNEVSAISLASRPKDTKYQPEPKRSALIPAFRAYHDDPAVVALIEKLHASWRPVAILQWRMENGRIVPTILHVKEYRKGLSAMFTEVWAKAGADTLLRMIGDHALRHEELGLPLLAASTDESRATQPKAKTQPRTGDIIEEIRRLTHCGSFSKETLRRDAIAAHPEWDQETKDKVPECVTFVWTRLRRVW